MQERKDHVTKRKSIFIRMALVVIPLVLLLLSQTALAENTYVITDGDRVRVYSTDTTDPATVLTEAGLALGEDDTYTAQMQGGVSQITVQRQQTVNIRQGDHTIQVTTNGETVGALLDRLDIPTDEYTTVSAPLDSNIYGGMTLTVTKNVSRSPTRSFTATTAPSPPALPRCLPPALTVSCGAKLRCSM